MKGFTSGAAARAVPSAARTAGIRRERKVPLARRAEAGAAASPKPGAPPSQRGGRPSLLQRLRSAHAGRVGSPLRGSTRYNEPAGRR